MQLTGPFGPYQGTGLVARTTGYRGTVPDTSTDTSATSNSVASITGYYTSTHITCTTNSYTTMINTNNTNTTTRNIDKIAAL